METLSALGKPDCEPLQNTENNTQMVSYSLRACGSFCICSKIMRMAGSLMICCTSGSAMALRFTSSGLSLRIAWLTIQRCRPSVASCSGRGIEKYNVNMSGHHHQHNPPRKLRDNEAGHVYLWVGVKLESFLVHIHCFREVLHSLQCCSLACVTLN